MSWNNVIPVEWLRELNEQRFKKEDIIVDIDTNIPWKVIDVRKKVVGRVMTIVMVDHPEHCVDRFESEDRFRRANGLELAQIKVKEKKKK